VHTALRLSSNVDRPPKVIQVTSSVPGEGKTVFAVSLATLLAQTHRTLLLDLDLRHPSVQREIEIPQETALVGYITGELSYNELVHRDALSGLDVIAVRRPQHNPPTLLTSQRLRDLVDRLRDDYDYVVVDGTPVLGVSDGKLTSELVDAVLLVAQWEKTTFNMVHDSLKELVDLRVMVSGVVLTQVNLSRHARYGYGGSDDLYRNHKKYYKD
jgi:polysaccharide biosynthesis transport protein